MTTDVAAVSPHDFCQSYGISRSCFNGIVERGELEVIRAGRRLVVPLDAIRRWREAARVRPAEV